MFKPHSESDIETKSDLLDILDPARINSMYNDMSVAQLKEIINKRNSSVRKLSDKDFIEIYNLDLSNFGFAKSSSKRDEIVSLKNRILNQNSMIDEQRKTITKLEKEIEDLKQKYKELENRKTFRDEVYEKGSFASFVAAAEAEENDLPIKPKYYDYDSGIKANIPPIVARYTSYTPSRKYKLSLFGTEADNGNLNEEDAIKLAIQNSERDIEQIADKPFEKMDTSNSFNSPDHSNMDVVNDDPFEDLDEQKYSYDHLTDRPSSLTDEMLDQLVKILLERKFEEIKNLLASWPDECSRYIRSRKYNSETFKQMMVSKSINIHKCIIA